MPTPLTTTTEQDDLILRFLRAAQTRVLKHPGRVPINRKESQAALEWLRGLVGKINEDGSVA